MHDNTPGKGTNLSTTPPIRVSTFGYAEDLALMVGTRQSYTCRLSQGYGQGVENCGWIKGIGGHGSENSQDLKTKVLHVHPQDPVTETTNGEVVKERKFVCPHLNCGFRFFTKHGMLIHAGRCEWNKEFDGGRILECKGPFCASKYHIRWKNYEEKDDTWGTPHKPTPNRHQRIRNREWTLWS